MMPVSSDYKNDQNRTGSSTEASKDEGQGSSISSAEITYIETSNSPASPPPLVVTIDSDEPSPCSPVQPPPPPSFPQASSSTSTSTPTITVSPLLTTTTPLNTSDENSDNSVIVVLNQVKKVPPTPSLGNRWIKVGVNKNRNKDNSNANRVSNNKGTCEDNNNNNKDKLCPITKDVKKKRLKRLNTNNDEPTITKHFSIKKAPLKKRKKDPRLVYEPFKPFKCCAKVGSTFCGQCFETAKELHGHIKELHTTSTFTCKDCGTCCGTETLYRNHRMSKCLEN